MKPLTMLLSPVSCHFLRLSPKCPPQHPIHAHLQPIRPCYSIKSHTKFQTHTTQKAKLNFISFECRSNTCMFRAAAVSALSVCFAPGSVFLPSLTHHTVTQPQSTHVVYIEPRRLAFSPVILRSQAINSQLISPAHILLPSTCVQSRCLCSLPGQPWNDQGLHLLLLFVYSGVPTVLTL
jgi:hypothetical protein